MRLHAIDLRWREVGIFIGLKRLFHRAMPAGAPPSWRAAAGLRLYAIGDVHGRYDLLTNLLAQIDMDPPSTDAVRKVIIFLGDLIDRGPASRQVIEQCMVLAEGPTECVFLRGNHEQLLLDVWNGREGAVATFHRAGARATMLSYGVDPADYDRWGFDELGRQVRSTIPAAHIAFIREFGHFYRSGDFLFAHAGIRPGIAISAQRAEDLIWIRQDFTRSSRDHGLMVVHGHSMHADVDIRPNRVGIDTGAYATGLLTAMVVEEDQYHFLATARD